MKLGCKDHNRRVRIYTEDSSVSPSTVTPRSARDMEAKKMDDDCCRAGPAIRATSTRMLVRKETEMISENTSPDSRNIADWRTARHF